MQIGTPSNDNETQSNATDRQSIMMLQRQRAARRIVPQIRRRASRRWFLKSVRLADRQRAALADADERRAAGRRARSWPAPDAMAAARRAVPARSTMRLRCGSFSAAAANRAWSGPVTTISAALSRRSSAFSSDACDEQVLACAASTPSNSRSACVAPGVVAGQRREPDRFCAAIAVRIRRRVVAGRGRPHHQAFGVVGGEVIAAVAPGWRSAGRTRAARSGPGRDSRRWPVASYSARRGADHLREVGRQSRDRAGALPRQEWPSRSPLVMSLRDEIEGAPRAIDPGRLAEHRAGVAPAPRSSGRSSRPESCRRARAARAPSARRAACRAAPPAGPRLPRCAACCCRRLRMLWPSKLPSAVTS